MSVTVKRFHHTLSVIWCATMISSETTPVQHIHWLILCSQVFKLPSLCWRYQNFSLNKVSRESMSLHPDINLVRGWCICNFVKLNVKTGVVSLSVKTDCSVVITNYVNSYNTHWLQEGSGTAYWLQTAFPLSCGLRIFSDSNVVPVNSRQ